MDDVSERHRQDATQQRGVAWEIKRTSHRGRYRKELIRIMSSKNRHGKASKAMSAGCQNGVKEHNGRWLSRSGARSKTQGARGKTGGHALLPAVVEVHGWTLGKNNALTPTRRARVIVDVSTDSAGEACSSRTARLQCGVLAGDGERGQNKDKLAR